MNQLGLISMVALVVISSPAYCEEAPRISGDAEVLINRLTEVSELGYGYSTLFSGSQFLPQADADEVHTLVLGSQRPTKSSTIEAIVRQGVIAVPSLLKHLDDDRKTQIEPVKGMMWMSFADEYDFNQRVRKQSPEGVNRDTFGEKQPSTHQITVGDLCYVALGQILNRRLSATRYQPSGGLVVSSPTYSKRLCAVVREDWQGLTEEKHRQSLIHDFLTPDNEDRRIGAYRRLAFYYPKSVEPLVLKQLSVPTSDVFEVDRFVREQLYPEKSKIEGKRIFDEFVKRNGSASSNAILLQLFSDLDKQEADEQGRWHPPPKEKHDARAMLTLLYGYPKDVKSTQVPFVDTWAETEKARFIKALVHDDSKSIGDVVKQAFLQNPQDDYFGPACLRCLASRGYAPFLVAQLEAIDFGVVEPNRLHLEYLQAISTSKEQAVQEKLFDILKRTRSAAYFMAALEGINQPDGDMVLVLAKKILEGLPEDTDQGQNLLGMIGERYPASARRIYKDFLRTGSARRAETMCRVLWYGNPLSKEILAPLLDDKRDLKGFSIPMRVCDRAAQAISHTTDRIRFDSEWTTAQKDEAIIKLKHYCEESTPSNQTQGSEGPLRRSK